MFQRCLGKPREGEGERKGSLMMVKVAVKLLEVQIFRDKSRELEAGELG